MPELSTATEMSALRNCNVIIAAAGTNDALIDAHHLPAEGPVLIADLSVPGVVSAHVDSLPHVHRAAFAGTVSVSGTPDFVMASHLAPGTTFSCTGEVMVLGLTHSETDHLNLVGSIDPCNVEILDQLAQQNGFYRRFERASPRKRTL